MAIGIGAGVTIEDSPDLEIRGVMIDISRSKVPTLKTLKEMNIWGMDGNNSIINKRERLILILPFLTGFGALVALRPVFSSEMPMVLAKMDVGRYNRYNTVFYKKGDYRATVCRCNYCFYCCCFCNLHLPYVHKA